MRKGDICGKKEKSRGGKLKTKSSKEVDVVVVFRREREVWSCFVGLVAQAETERVS